MWKGGGGPPSPSALDGFFTTGCVRPGSARRCPKQGLRCYEDCHVAPRSTRTCASYTEKTDMIEKESNKRKDGRTTHTKKMNNVRYEHQVNAPRIELSPNNKRKAH